MKILLLFVTLQVYGSALSSKFICPKEPLKECLRCCTLLTMSRLDCINNEMVIKMPVEDLILVNYIKQNFDFCSNSREIAEKVTPENCAKKCESSNAK